MLSQRSPLFRPSAQVVEIPPHLDRIAFKMLTEGMHVLQVPQIVTVRVLSCLFFRSALTDRVNEEIKMVRTNSSNVLWKQFLIFFLSA